MKRQYTAVLCIGLTLAAPCWAIYNPRTGRFMQRDPVGAVNPAQITPLVNRAAAFVPQYGSPTANREYHDGMNLYQYAQSRPLVLRDPSGLFGTLDIAFGVGSFFGGLYAAQQLEHKGVLSYKFTKFVATMAVKSPLFKVFRDKMPLKPLLWEVIKDKKNALAPLAAHAVYTHAIMGFAGYNYGVTAYAMWTLFEDMSGLEFPF